MLRVHPVPLGRWKTHLFERTRQGAKVTDETDLLETKIESGETAQLGKALAAESADLRSIPETHVVKEERQLLLQVVL